MQKANSYLSEIGAKSTISDNYNFIFVGIWVKKCIFRQLYGNFLLSLRPAIKL